MIKHTVSLAHACTHLRGEQSWGVARTKSTRLPVASPNRQLISSSSLRRLQQRRATHATLKLAEVTRETQNNT